MKRIALIASVTALVLAAPAAAQAATHFEGTVVSVNRDNRTFRLHDSERGTIRIKVTSRTRFERIAGFSGLRKGMSASFSPNPTSNSSTLTLATSNKTNIGTFTVTITGVSGGLSHVTSISVTVHR